MSERKLRKSGKSPMKVKAELLKKVDAPPLPDIMRGLTDVQAETIEHILSDTMNLESNRGAKSRIPIPVNTARLQIMAALVPPKYPMFARLLTTLETDIRENQVSEEGKRVLEVVHALSESLRDKEKTTAERLTSPPE
jgi:hypothetical protein